jgi:hypothetical protein
MEIGHPHLLPAKGVHFFSHDGPDLSQYTIAKGHVNIDTGANRPDEIGANEQFMAYEFGFGRRLSQGFAEG